MKIQISLSDGKIFNAHYAAVIKAFNAKTGGKFKPEDYEGWLEGDAEDWAGVEKFDKAVKKFMGKDLYEQGEQLARLDGMFQQMLFSKTKVPGGGYNLKSIIKQGKKG